MTPEKAANHIRALAVRIYVDKTGTGGIRTTLTSEDKDGVVDGKGRITARIDVTLTRPMRGAGGQTSETVSVGTQCARGNTIAEAYAALRCDLREMLRARICDDTSVFSATGDDQ